MRMPGAHNFFMKAGFVLFAFRNVYMNRHTKIQKHVIHIYSIIVKNQCTPNYSLRPKTIWCSEWVMFGWTWLIIFCRPFSSNVHYLYYIRQCIIPLLVSTYLIIAGLTSTGALCDSIVAAANVMHMNDLCSWGWKSFSIVNPFDELFFFSDLTKPPLLWLNSQFSPELIFPHSL